MDLVDYSNSRCPCHVSGEVMSRRRVVILVGHAIASFVENTLEADNI